MVLNILKNAIFLGILAAVLTYVYMMWDNNRKHKRDPSQPKKSVNLMAPLIVGIIVWFLANGYFDYGTNKNIINQKTTVEGNDVTEGAITPGAPFKTNKYFLTGKGIAIPNKLPDVFIETYS